MMKEEVAKQRRLFAFGKRKNDEGYDDEDSGDYGSKENIPLLSHYPAFPESPDEKDGSLTRWREFGKTRSDNVDRSRSSPDKEYSYHDDEVEPSRSRSTPPKFQSAIGRRSRCRSEDSASTIQTANGRSTTLDNIEEEEEDDLKQEEEEVPDDEKKVKAEENEPLSCNSNHNEETTTQAPATLLEMAASQQTSKNKRMEILTEILPGDDELEQQQPPLNSCGSLQSIALITPREACNPRVRSTKSESTRGSSSLISRQGTFESTQTRFSFDEIPIPEDGEKEQKPSAFPCGTCSEPLDLQMIQTVVDAAILQIQKAVSPKQYSEASRQTLNSYDSGTVMSDGSDEASRPSTTISKSLTNGSDTFGNMHPAIPLRHTSTIKRSATLNAGDGKTDEAVVSELTNALRKSTRKLDYEVEHLRKCHSIVEVLETSLHKAEEKIKERALERRGDSGCDLQSEKEGLGTKIKETNQAILQLKKSIETHEEQLKGLDFQITIKREQLRRLCEDETTSNFESDAQKEILAKDVFSAQSTLEGRKAAIEADRATLDRKLLLLEALGNKGAAIQRRLEESELMDEETCKDEIDVVRRKFERKISKQRSVLSMSRRSVERRQEQVQRLQSLLSQSESQKTTGDLNDSVSSSKDGSVSSQPKHCPHLMLNQLALILGMTGGLDSSKHHETVTPDTSVDLSDELSLDSSAASQDSDDDDDDSYREPRGKWEDPDESPASRRSSKSNNSYREPRGKWEDPDESPASRRSSKSNKSSRPRKYQDQVLSPLDRIGESMEDKVFQFATSVDDQMQELKSQVKQLVGKRPKKPLTN